MARVSSTWAGGIHESGMAPATSSSRRCRGVGLVGPGSFLVASAGGGVGRLRQMSHEPRCLQLLHDVAPTGAAVQREVDGHTVEAHQLVAHGRPVRGHDPPAGQLAVTNVEIVEGALSPMHVERSYDRHGTSSSSCNAPAPEHPRPLPHSKLAAAVPEGSISSWATRTERTNGPPAGAAHDSETSHWVASRSTVRHAAR